MSKLKERTEDIKYFCKTQHHRQSNLACYRHIYVQLWCSWAQGGEEPPGNGGERLGENGGGAAGGPLCHTAGAPA